MFLFGPGHSLTIIGVEQLQDGSTCLLVFNPSTSPQMMKRLKADNAFSAPSQMKALRKSLRDLTKDQYQIVAVVGTMSSQEEFEVGSYQNVRKYCIFFYSLLGFYLLEFLMVKSGVKLLQSWCRRILLSS